MYEYNGKPMPEFLRIMGKGHIRTQESGKNYPEKSIKRELGFKPRPAPIDKPRLRF